MGREGTWELIKPRSMALGTDLYISYSKLTGADATLPVNKRQKGETLEENSLLPSFGRYGENTLDWKSTGPILGLEVALNALYTY